MFSFVLAYHASRDLWLLNASIEILMFHRGPCLKALLRQPVSTAGLLEPAPTVDKRPQSLIVQMENVAFAY